MLRQWLSVKKPNSPTSKPSTSKQTQIGLQDEHSGEQFKKKPIQPSKNQKLSRAFQSKWQIGRPWLVFNNTSNLMTCTYCIENESTLTSQKVLKSKKFIDGCDSIKSESIAYHEASKAHILATKCHSAKAKPQNAPAAKALNTINKHNHEKLSILFRNAHALAKHRKSIRDYNWLCNLDEAKGLNRGKTYRNVTACRTFIKYVAMDAAQTLNNAISNAKFFSITSDGSTDAGIVEQEVVFIRYSFEGAPVTKFVGMKSPASPDATGIKNAIMEAMEDVGIDQNVVANKLVGFGCDGASVMLGQKGGVSAKLKEVQPSLVTIHCFAHRLELAYKDVIKGNKLYDSTIVLLMGLYYFYHNSPKQRLNLRRSFESISEMTIIPTRVGGTRWVGHVVLSINNFLKGYKAIRAQLEDCVAQKNKGEAQNKARGYLKLMKRPDIIGFIHLLLDVLIPLHVLSKTLQSNDTTLADVGDKIDMAKDIISNYINSDGPKLKAFLHEAEDDSFRGECLSGKIPTESLATHRKKLSLGLLKSFDKRFCDLSDEVLSATRIVNFKHWPSSANKEEIRDFGVQELSDICKHFINVLTSGGVDVGEVQSEWVTLKALIYSRYKDRVKNLIWPDIYASIKEDHNNLLAVIDLIITLPATSAENERGFSSMKLTKTSSRCRMGTATLTDLMAIQMADDTVSDYNPDSAIDLWLNGKERRPTFSDVRPIKRTRLTLHEEVATLQEEVDETMEATAERGDAEVDDESEYDEGYDEDFDENDENELSEEDVSKMLKELE